MSIELMNKTVVLTGATSGIGLATAESLLKEGACVIGVGRSDERCENAKRQLEDAFPNAKIAFIACDLSSLKNVKQLGEEIERVIKAWGRDCLDVLINNAGTFTSWYMSSSEGFEMQFAVNHLAPFLLTHLLIPLLRSSSGGRVITMSSGSHYHTRIHWKDVSLRKHYNCLLAYKQSKLANVLFSQELKKRSGLTVFAADPGLVNTEMGLKNTTGLPKLIWNLRKKSGDKPSDAAKGIVFLAGEQSIKSSKDLYFKACRPKKPNPYVLNELNSKKLWQISETMCGIHSEYYSL